MSKHILVTGANGQLGQSLQEISKAYPKLKFTFLSKAQLDITNQKEVLEYVGNSNFDAVVNCAAYTAVDKAESEEDAAYLINVKATAYLAEATALKNIPFIHISTDYVFGGWVSQPRKETDKVDPINVYGKTKLEGENKALNSNSKTIIIRTSWVYSQFANNFVKTMLRLFKEKEEIQVVNDQIGSPTNALDLADAIAQILSKGEMEYGIFNYSNEGNCSWFEFAMKIKELTNATTKIIPVPTTAFPTAAKRPAFSLLDKTKIKTSYQIQIPEWESSLIKMLKEIKA
nr:dTDP-4-dehydrorhamnose reductase [uncultured Flavobacterium sp.]